MSQSRSMTVSPSSLRMTLSTPCVEGCCGPMFRIISGLSSSVSLVVAISTWCTWNYEDKGLGREALRVRTACASLAYRRRAFILHPSSFILAFVASRHAPRFQDEADLRGFAAFPARE